MDSLRQLSSPTAFVIRNGESIPIAAKDVVPGDLVAIKAGDVVAADVRVPRSLFEEYSVIKEQFSFDSVKPLASRSRNSFLQARVCR